MRLKLKLDHAANQSLPINYQYYISSWIYKTLNLADEKYSEFLHGTGYSFAGKNYKLFTFSRLQPRRFRIDKQTQSFILSESPTILHLSFQLDEQLQNFVKGLFQSQRFSLGRVNFEIKGIEILPKPAFHSTMRFRLLTPLCLSRNVAGKEHAQYQHPEDEGYADLLFQNLLNKGTAAIQPTFPGVQLQPHPDFQMGFQLLSEPRSQLLHIKGIKMRGYTYDFEISMPTKCLEVGYFGGFGQGNSSVGMGMVAVL